MGAQNRSNPRFNPEISGKRQRYVTQTGMVRQIRFDHESDRALMGAAQCLRGTEPGDTVSVSLVVRRAIRRYREHLDLAEPQTIEHEKRVVRERSRLPHRRSLTTLQ